MKKVAVVLSLVLLVSVMLVGCQGKDGGAGTPAGASGIVGVWKLTGAEMAGMTMDAASLADFGMAEMTLEFKADGVVALNFGGESEEATYTEAGDKVEISENGSVAMTLSKDGDTLVADQDGVKMIFSK